MSWFKSFAVIGVLFLTACGFQPMYTATGGDIESRYAEIEVMNVANREGQLLRNLLIDRLYTKGRPVNPRYTLDVSKLSIRDYKVGIRKDETSTRSFLEFNARMSLKDSQTGREILKRTYRSVGGYDILKNQYANIVARQTMTENLLNEMTDNIMNDINIYFYAHPEVK
jgi:hypothetical protein